jgi:predicted phage terminase large subunit-like protein
LFWPARFDAAAVEALKFALGSYGSAGQLQQTPAPQGGGMVKRAWLRYYTSGKNDECEMMNDECGRKREETSLRATVRLRHASAGQEGSEAIQSPAKGWIASAPAASRNDDQERLRLHSSFRIHHSSFSSPAPDVSRLEVFVTVDLATSERELADYTAAIVWGLDRAAAPPAKWDSRSRDDAPDAPDSRCAAAFGNVPARTLYLLDAYHERASSPDVTRALSGLQQRWRPTALYVECAGFQLSMYQHLWDAGLPVRKLAPQRDKVTRLSAALPYLEAGRVLLPCYAAWLADLERELLSFPLAAHDDFVDAFSYGVAVGMGELSYPRAEMIGGRR